MGHQRVVDLGRQVGVDAAEPGGAGGRDDRDILQGQQPVERRAVVVDRRRAGAVIAVGQVDRAAGLGAEQRGVQFERRHRRTDREQNRVGQPVRAARRVWPEHQPGIERMAGVEAEVGEGQFAAARIDHGDRQGEHGHRGRVRQRVPIGLVAGGLERAGAEDMEIGAFAHQGSGRQPHGVALGAGLLGLGQGRGQVDAVGIGDRRAAREPPCQGDLLVGGRLRVARVDVVDDPAGRRCRPGRQHPRDVEPRAAIVEESAHPVREVVDEGVAADVQVVDAAIDAGEILEAGQ